MTLGDTACTARGRAGRCGGQRGVGSGWARWGPEVRGEGGPQLDPCFSAQRSRSGRAPRSHPPQIPTSGLSAASLRHHGPSWSPLWALAALCLSRAAWFGSPAPKSAIPTPTSSLSSSLVLPICTSPAEVSPAPGFLGPKLLPANAGHSSAPRPKTQHPDPKGRGSWLGRRRFQVDPTPAGLFPGEARVRPSIRDGDGARTKAASKAIGSWGCIATFIS